MLWKLSLPLLAAAITSAQTISTFAGNGAAGSTGDGGQATQAEINRVVGLAADAAGNIYMADQNNNRVRKVDTHGVITTFAGTGQPGFGGDDGQATQALLNAPLGVCVAPSGDIYINDTSNLRVRRVSPTGIITTVAGNGISGSTGDGGQATAASMTIPIRCAVDRNGNLFIDDQGASIIRKVNTSGIISTYAGVNGVLNYSGDNGPATAAEMNNPTAVSVDAAGNLFITDQFNHRIRRVDAVTGIITTVAGNGQGTYAGDNGPAASASLNYPGETVVDPAGTLFIVDTVNNRIRKVSGGIITTVAGNGTPGYTGDNGPPGQAELNTPFPMTLDYLGNLYVGDGVYTGDTTDNRIREITGVAAASTTPAITAVLNGASFQAGVVPNSWITITGVNLAPTTDTWANSVGADGSLPTSLDKVSVSVGGEAAYIYYISSTQINALAPNVASGPLSVSVTTPAGASPSFSATAQPQQPAFFEWPGGYVVATDPSYNWLVKDGTFNGVTTAPAQPGETIVLWGTGLGPTTPTAPVGFATPSGTVYNTATPVTVTINNVNAPVLGAALTSGSAGLYQVAVTVPASLANGDYAVVATVNGAQSPASALITIHQ